MKPCARRLTLAAASFGLAAPAHAADLGSFGATTVTLDSSLQLSSVVQTKSAAGEPQSSAPELVSGRADWLGALDVEYRDFGLRVSGAAWADGWADDADQERPGFTFYPRNSGNYVLGYPTFLPHQQAYLQDAFVHGATTLPNGDRVSFRIGRYVLLWGNSVYFSEEGIAAGQAPIDATQARLGSTYDMHDLFRAVGQASASWQLHSGVTIDGTYQFEFRPDRLEISDDYLSTTPLLGPQSARAIASLPEAETFPFSRGAVHTPDGARFGLAVKFRAADIDFGLYLRRFDSPTPIYELKPTSSAAPASYTVDYPSGIMLFGLGLATSIGNASLGAELSARRNTPLVATAIVEPGAAYPEGQSLNGLVSCTWNTPPLPLLPAGAKWSGEIAIDTVFGPISHAAQMLPGRTRTAGAVKTVFEPQILHILPRIDLSVPITVSYNVFGRSEVSPALNQGTGTIGIGISARIHGAWQSDLSFTHYIGTPPFSFAPYQNEGGVESTYGDIIALRVRRSF